ncbi:TPA: DUF4406 domain-containing protein [Pseudomonas aeruginosa]|nr:DUF4406 domain-containing protein [Pseudomonas aeruginosa]HCF9605234.1 DUF4406 domain-containing protein [Pseudomonas aeruginosa]HCF9611355.1 DUF4406 domain-containing protein [Pseudomonas aeruginosa]HCF9643054.1 DUF4406 domain-containing protein [Pseudomonas aeruginosa]HCF9657243.1 DUF4406 domain-containing protein [Pseudomonas aeruginosa]
MKHRVYLSGPMTGIPDFNYPAFNAEEKRIRALEQIAALTDVSTGGIRMDVLQIAKQALSN